MNLWLCFDFFLIDFCSERQTMPFCSRCQEELDHAHFSKTQLTKGDKHRKCKNCIENAPQKMQKFNIDNLMSKHYENVVFNSCKIFPMSTVKTIIEYLDINQTGHGLHGLYENIPKNNQMLILHRNREFEFCHPQFKIQGTYKFKYSYKKLILKFEGMKRSEKGINYIIAFKFHGRVIIPKYNEIQIYVKLNYETLRVPAFSSILSKNTTGKYNAHQKQKIKNEKNRMRNKKLRMRKNHSKQQTYPDVCGGRGRNAQF
eukprot:906851_1